MCFKCILYIFRRAHSYKKRATEALFLKNLLISETFRIMGGLFFLRRLRNGRIGGGGLAFFEAPEKDDDTGEDKGNRQELPHIECHAGLEIDLVVLDELHDEAQAEEEYQENAENGTPFQLRQLFGIHPQERKAQNDVPERLIKLRRMVRHTVVVRDIAGEIEAPRQIGHAAVNLRIEQIAETDQRSGEADRDDEPVENPPDVKAVLFPIPAGEPDHRQYQGYRAAVARQAAVPGLENLQESFPGGKIILRLVEDTVTETGSDNRCNQQGIQQRIQDFFADSFPPDEPAEDEITDDETGHKQQGIPANAEIPPEMYQLVVDVPNNR